MSANGDEETPAEQPVVNKNKRFRKEKREVNASVRSMPALAHISVLF